MSCMKPGTPVGEKLEFMFLLVSSYTEHLKQSWRHVLRKPDRGKKINK